MATILCVDDEPAAVLILEDALQRAGHRTVGVHNVRAALKVLARGGVDLIVSDYRMPGATGLEFLEALEREGLDVPLIMVTGHASIEHAVAAIKAGAVDYITKPIKAQQLELAVGQALEFTRLRRENAQLREEVTRFRSAREIIGDSESLRRIIETVKMVAPTRATILFQGESGTGKELLARTVHNLSERRDAPFISLNCAALPENLVESTLFGHEKGAFTGAVKQVKGAFERAHGGTLLLDEVSEMRLDLQAKLLRVLQEQEFERVGGTAPVRVDVRVVATTNRDLASLAASGAFRQDLYYRLAVVPIQVPPLRERMDDIPVLVQHFAARTAREMGRPAPSLAPECFDLLRDRAWPGNLRELAHAVERAVILSPSGELTPDSFDRARFGLASGGPSDGAAQAGGCAGSGARGGAVGAASRGGTGRGSGCREGTGGAGDGAGIPATLNLEEMEGILIQRALDATGNNRTRAADLLGISVRTLRNKLNNPD